MSKDECKEAISNSVKLCIAEVLDSINSTFSKSISDKSFKYIEVSSSIEMTDILSINVAGGSRIAIILESRGIIPDKDIIDTANRTIYKGLVSSGLFCGRTEDGIHVYMTRKQSIKLSYNKYKMFNGIPSCVTAYILLLMVISVIKPFKSFSLDYSVALFILSPIVIIGFMQFVSFVYSIYKSSSMAHNKQ